MGDPSEYDHRIEIDGAVVETDNTRFAAHILRESGDSIDESRLEELCEAWESRSMNSSNPSAKRAAYCDAAEKLRAVLDEEEWTESPY